MAFSVTGGGTQYTMAAQNAAMQQMQATDQQQAATIQTQIAADAAKQQMERFKLMADLQTKIMEMTQEITLTKQKAAQKGFQGVNAYISS